MEPAVQGSLAGGDIFAHEVLRRQAAEVAPLAERDASYTPTTVTVAGHGHSQHHQEHRQFIVGSAPYHGASAQ